MLPCHWIVSTLDVLVDTLVKVKLLTSNEQHRH